ncbi:NUDIX domain-containing protein [Rhodobacteraceae bacterium 10Alg 79]|uniref:ADP-ribose pyrophosphatase n=2 Tax=Rhodalgimonas zhirmunskyi TaxID=2964767 RepID=A0AAJ1UAF9_9RHOB|nr:NUDIX domain-containing protein [Rhodoalgimonas zhirmunskyi]
MGVGALAPVPARLADHAVYWAEGEGFPLICAQPGGTAQGLLLRNVTTECRARLDYYELGFGYDLHEVEVTLDESGARETALVYFPQEGLWALGAPWSLADWVREWWPITKHSAREVMRGFGRRDAHENARHFTMIQTRALARALAEKEQIPCTLRANFGLDEIDVTGEEDSHAGFFLLKTYRLRHRRFDGEMSDEMSREVFIPGDAATVLPYDPVRDRVLLVEQFRMGLFGRGDRHPWCLEPIAGRLDGGEDAETCARREAQEEAGLTLSGLEKIISYYPTTGYSTEMLHAFVGIADLPEEGSRLGGVADEHEDIRSHIIAFTRAMELLEQGEINNGPLVMSLMWLARERDRLRGAA